ncbi:hypothetical protein [Coprobacter sp.]
MPTDYIVKTYIWADNGKVYSLAFMNSWGFDVEKAEKEGYTTVVPFFVPRFKKGTPLPVDSSKSVPRKFKVYK